MKSWILFFDKEGYHGCGSDYSVCFNLTPKNAVKKIYREFSWEKEHFNGGGFVVLTEWQFMMMSYNDIEKYYKKWGFKLNERN